jgi:glycosyltransferase 2 family protein
MLKQKNSPKKSWLPKLITVAFYILLIAGLVFYFKDLDLNKLAGITLDWPLVVLSVCAGLAFRYWGAYIWLTLLKGLGAQNIQNKVELNYVYAKSWLGRYIPGAATWMLGKVYFASQHGISKNKLAVSSLLEGALQITVLLVLSIIMLIFDSRLDTINPNLKLVLFVVLLGCIISLLPSVFNRAVAIVYKLVRKKTFESEHMANGKIITKGALLYAIGSFVIGLSLFFAAKAVYPQLGYENIIFVIGVGNLAGALGMLAVFAPSGIGIREGVYIALLGLIMPTEFALVIAIFSRILGIVIDLVFFCITWLVRSLASTD